MVSVSIRVYEKLRWEKIGNQTKHYKITFIFFYNMKLHMYPIYVKVFCLVSISSRECHARKSRMIKCVTNLNMFRMKLEQVRMKPG